MTHTPTLVLPTARTMIELMPVPTQTKLVSVNSASPGGLAGQPNPTLLPEALFTTGRQGEKGGVWGTPAITSTAGGGQVGITHSRLALIHVYANVRVYVGNFFRTRTPITSQTFQERVCVNTHVRNKHVCKYK